MKSDMKTARGGTIRSETGVEREKPIKGVSNEEALTGRKMGGGPTDLSRSVSGGKVPRT